MYYNVLILMELWLIFEYSRIEYKTRDDLNDLGELCLQVN